VLSTLSKVPTEAEILESGDCQTCRHYFGKTGPTCSHCKKQSVLRDYAAHIVCYRRQSKRVVAGASAHASGKKARTGNDSSASIALFPEDDLQDGEEFEVKMFDEGAVDGMVLMVLKLLRPHAGAYLMGGEDPQLGTLQPMRCAVSSPLSQPTGCCCWLCSSFL
jgi:hypothetical protein